MAEANTEMLESELKRAKAEASAAASANATSTPNSAPRPRPSLEGRPSGDASPRSQPLVKEKSFGFWARKASPLPSPALNNSAPADDDELARLREQVATQATQLDTLKQGKREIEAELEGLSQALFEEANKMVADERRRRAELEENLREARDEREALRATIKVLGGSAPGTEANSDDETERSSTGGDLTAHYAALRAGIDRVGARTPQPPGRVTKENAASPMPVASGASAASRADGANNGASEERREANGASSDGSDGSATPSEPSPEAEMPGAFGSASPKDGPKGSAAMNMPPMPVPLETEANPWG